MAGSSETSQHTYDSEGRDSGSSYKYDFALARYDNDGVLDTTFGTNGIVTTNFGNGYANAIALQKDGKIVVAGFNRDDTSGNFRFALARYMAGPEPGVCQGGPSQMYQLTTPIASVSRPCTRTG